MTIEQLAEQVGRLAEIQVETLRTIDRTTDNILRIIATNTERHDREMSELRQAQRVTEQSLTRLSDTLERFIQRGTNGRQ
jgi:hypothetical protein